MEFSNSIEGIMDKNTILIIVCVLSSAFGYYTDKKLGVGKLPTTILYPMACIVGWILGGI